MIFVKTQAQQDAPIQDQLSYQDLLVSVADCTEAGSCWWVTAQCIKLPIHIHITEPN
jgi:hypothetical protein